MANQVVQNTGMLGVVRAAKDTIIRFAMNQQDLEVDAVAGTTTLVVPQTRKFFEGETIVVRDQTQGEIHTIKSIVDGKVMFERKKEELYTKYENLKRMYEEKKEPLQKEKEALEKEIKRVQKEKEALEKEIQNQNTKINNEYEQIKMQLGETVENYMQRLKMMGIKSSYALIDSYDKFGKDRFGEIISYRLPNIVNAPDPQFL